MKTIAYRIWDKENKKFHFSGSTPTMLSSFFDFTKVLHTRDKMPYQQYTGLSDKNQVWIYEGDIVKHCNTKEYNSLHQQKQLFKVVWVKENFSKDICDGRDDIFMETGFKFKKLFDGPSTVFCPEKDLEVIGNIFANPELLGNN